MPKEGTIDLFSPKTATILTNLSAVRSSWNRLIPVESSDLGGKMRDGSQNALTV